MEAITPCSCGSSDPMPVVEHRIDGQWYACVECPDCDRAGPERQSTGHEVAERAAIESWNQMRLDEDGVGSDEAGAA